LFWFLKFWFWWWGRGEQEGKEGAVVVERKEAAEVGGEMMETMVSCEAEQSEQNRVLLDAKVG
jgi:hypothetical protein